MFLMFIRRLMGQIVVELTPSRAIAEGRAEQQFGRQRPWL